MHLNERAFFAQISTLYYDDKWQISVINVIN